MPPLVEMVSRFVLCGAVSTPWLVVPGYLPVIRAQVPAVQAQHEISPAVIDIRVGPASIANGRLSAAHEGAFRLVRPAELTSHARLLTPQFANTTFRLETSGRWRNSGIVGRLIGVPRILE